MQLIYVCFTFNFCVLPVAVSAVMPLTMLTCDADVLQLVLTRLMLTRPRHTVLMHCHDPISILQLVSSSYNDEHFRH